MKKILERQGRLLAEGSYRTLWWEICDGSKGTAVGLDFEVGEHVDRSVANFNGG